MTKVNSVVRDLNYVLPSLRTALYVADCITLLGTTDISILKNYLGQDDLDKLNKVISWEPDTDIPKTRLIDLALECENGKILAKKLNAWPSQTVSMSELGDIFNDDDDLLFEMRDAWESQRSGSIDLAALVLHTALSSARVKRADRPNLEEAREQVYAARGQEVPDFSAVITDRPMPPRKENTSMHAKKTEKKPEPTIVPNSVDPAIVQQVAMYMAAINAAQQSASPSALTTVPPAVVVPRPTTLTETVERHVVPVSIPTQMKIAPKTISQMQNERVSQEDKDALKNLISGSATGMASIKPSEHVVQQSNVEEINHYTNANVLPAITSLKKPGKK